jgi:hypothetical protein
MKKILSGICIAMTCCIFAAFPQSRVPVFTSGTDGHKSYRIPAIISLPNGELLAFCEGRVNNAGDFGDINIVPIETILPLGSVSMRVKPGKKILLSINRSLEWKRTMQLILILSG